MCVETGLILQQYHFCPGRAIDPRNTLKPSRDEAIHPPTDYEARDGPNPDQHANTKGHKERRDEKHHGHEDPEEGEDYSHAGRECRCGEDEADEDEQREEGEEQLREEKALRRIVSGCPESRFQGT